MVSYNSVRLNIEALHHRPTPARQPHGDTGVGLLRHQGLPQCLLLEFE
jgi:hypothetical protein